MNQEQRIVYTRGLLLQAEIKMQGMMALNQHRLQRGETLAYDDEAFFALIDEFGVNHNALITNLQDI